MVIRDQKHLATLSTGQRGGSVVQDLVTKCEDICYQMQEAAGWKVRTGSRRLSSDLDTGTHAPSSPSSPHKYKHLKFHYIIIDNIYTLSLLLEVLSKMPP